MSQSLPWNIIHLDLSQPLPSLNAEAGYVGVYLVIWWQTFPLGQIELQAAQLPLSPPQILARILPVITPNVQARFHSDIWEEYTRSDNPLTRLWQDWTQPLLLPRVSVVICTRDRPEQLAYCLRSLQQLTPAPHEIIVVDNAPRTPATEQLVATIPGIRYVREPQPGLSIARNTGIQRSTGEIIAFTDDDVRVAPDWIDRLGRSFHQPEVMAVTGLVLPIELETEAQILFELEHGCLRGNFRQRLFDSAFFQVHRRIGVPVWQIGAGANMAFRRSLFQQVGDFDPRLGAGASGCSEDSEFWYRILAAGGTCLYEPAIVVYHRHRPELHALHNQMYQYMRGHVAALLIQFARYGHWGNLYRLAWALPRHYLGCLVKGLLTGFRGKYRTTPMEVMGCAAGVWFYLRHCLQTPSAPRDRHLSQCLAETSSSIKFD